MSSGDWVPSTGWKSWPASRTALGGDVLQLLASMLILSVKELKQSKAPSHLRLLVLKPLKNQEMKNQVIALDDK